jgi:hypothetical protein
MDFEYQMEIAREVMKKDWHALRSLAGIKDAINMDEYEYEKRRRSDFLWDLYAGICLGIGSIGWLYVLIVTALQHG